MKPTLKTSPNVNIPFLSIKILKIKQAPFQRPALRFEFTVHGFTGSQVKTSKEPAFRLET